jgi:hypothetical protein
MAGKGSKQRPTDKRKFKENYDRIFNGRRKSAEVGGSSDNELLPPKGQGENTQNVQNVTYFPLDYAVGLWKFTQKYDNLKHVITLRRTGDQSLQQQMSPTGCLSALARQTSGRTVEQATKERTDRSARADRIRVTLQKLISPLYFRTFIRRKSAEVLGLLTHPRHSASSATIQSDYDLDANSAVKLPRLRVDTV